MKTYPLKRNRNTLVLWCAKQQLITKGYETAEVRHIEDKITRFCKRHSDYAQRRGYLNLIRQLARAKRRSYNNKSITRSYSSVSDYAVTNIIDLTIEQQRKSHIVISLSKWRSMYSLGIFHNDERWFTDYDVKTMNTEDIFSVLSDTLVCGPTDVVQILHNENNFLGKYQVTYTKTPWCARSRYYGGLRSTHFEGFFGEMRANIVGLTHPEYPGGPQREIPLDRWIYPAPDYEEIKGLPINLGDYIDMVYINGFPYVSLTKLFDEVVPHNINNTALFALTLLTEVIYE